MIKGRFKQRRKIRGGRGGARPSLASQNGLAPPPGKPGAPPKNSLKMLLLGAIFEKKFWGGPQTPRIGARRPPSEISFFAPLHYVVVIFFHAVSVVAT